VSLDLRLNDGGVLRVHDSAEEGGASAFTILWHHGSPQTGALLKPLLVAGAERSIRLVSYGRPSYGGSSPRPGRDVASAASDVAQVADALGLDRFAVMGASGGGPHALACAALLPDRVTGAASIAGLAPYGAAGIDWFGGMADDAALRAAARGREARERYEETAAGPDGIIDDDVAYATPWGFDVETILAPVLLVHGGQDRVVPPAHSDWLLRHCRDAELWVRPHDGHISVLNACPVAMDWLLAHD
jgi:pimeloyl-ACP methyl ester carboxylesterase